MADYYQLYRRGFVDTVNFESHKFYQNQMVVFKYRGTQGLRVVLTLDEFPRGTVHCLRLNSIHPDKLSSTLRKMISNVLVLDYSKAIQYSVYDDRLRLNEYRLPLVRMKNARGYYSSFVKKSVDVSKQGIYRTYFAKKMINPKVVVPNLQYFKFLAPNLKPIEVSDPERMRFLEPKQSPDDRHDKFTEQDEYFD